MRRQIYVSEFSQSFISEKPAARTSLGVNQDCIPEFTLKTGKGSHYSMKLKFAMNLILALGSSYRCPVDFIVTWRWKIDWGLYGATGAIFLLLHM